MTLEQQREAARLALAEDAEHVRAAGRDLVHLDLEALLAHPLRDVRGHAGLGGAGLAGADHARNADEVARERNQLAFVDVGEDVGGAHGGDRTTCRAYCWGKDRMTESSRMTRYSSRAM